MAERTYVIWTRKTDTLAWAWTVMQEGEGVTIGQSVIAKSRATSYFRWLARWHAKRHLKRYHRPDDRLVV